MSKPVAETQARQADAIDQHVGKRLRARRMLLGMSQTELGEKIGITFQQIQKYERGFNRVSASKLQQIGEALGVSVQFFFQDGEEALEESLEELKLLPDREAVRLLRAFARIEKVSVRRALVAHAEAIALCEEGD